MENFTPDGYVKRNMSLKEFDFAFKHLRERYGIRKINITGGEPTLNPKYIDILKIAKKRFDIVEITTNAYALSIRDIEILGLLNLDLVKVSFDSADRDIFEAISGVKDHGVFEKVIFNIHRLCEGPLKVALNTVVMKRNLCDIDKLIDFAMNIGCSIHLLDYVFYPTKRQDWERQFVPLEIISEIFSRRMGSPQIISRYGCTFYQFDFDNIYIRFKDSMAGTTRAIVCDNCYEYCQEGPYGLKLSTHGWVTACPSIDPNKGFLLSPSVDHERLSDNLSLVLPMFTGTFYDSHSFTMFLQKRSLKPTLTKEDIYLLFKGSHYFEPNSFII